MPRYFLRILGSRDSLTVYMLIREKLLFMDAGMKIMIVEDDRILAEEIRQFLLKWGYQAAVAEQFENIAAECLAGQPHLILLDVNLPYYDGFYWCRKLREQSQVPVIYISSRSDDMDKIMAIAQGGDDYVEKPFRLELLKALGTLVSNTEDNYTARIVTGPDSGRDREWIKILYSLCVFLVMVFITASGSILFMKLYNDAFEEVGRYDVLQKIGCPYKTLKRAVSRELLASYVLPLLVMWISSCFSVHAMEKVMYASLTGIRRISVGIIVVFFYLCYRMSVGIYLKNAGIRRI